MRQIAVLLLMACSSGEPAAVTATDLAEGASIEDDVSSAALDADTAPPPFEGYCAGTCETDEDCGTGTVCRARRAMLRCWPDDRPQWDESSGYPDWGECVADEHCAVRQVCGYTRPQLECARSCRTDAECEKRREENGGGGVVCVDSLCEEGRLGEDCSTETETRHIVVAEPRPTGFCLGHCTADDQCQDGRLCLAR